MWIKWTIFIAFLILIPILIGYTIIQIKKRNKLIDE